MDGRGFKLSTEIFYLKAVPKYNVIFGTFTGVFKAMQNNNKSPI